MTAMVIEAFDESLYVNILDHIFALKEVPFREVKPKTLDPITEDDKPRKDYIPPVSHP